MVNVPLGYKIWNLWLIKKAQEIENEVNALDDNITKNIRKELNFLRKDLENLEDEINDLKDAWELIDNDYGKLEDAIERF